MPLENAEFIDSLQPDWPTGRDPRSQGDDHIRQLKKVLQNTFPNATGAITGTPEQINNLTEHVSYVPGTGVAGDPERIEIHNADWTGTMLAAVGTASKEQLNGCTALAVNWAVIQQIIFPPGAEYRSYTDARNPVDILGFGAWEAVTGLIAGVGTAVDSQGYGQTYEAGYHAENWRVRDEHIVAQQLDVTLAMDAVSDHEHHIQGWSDESKDGGVAAGAGSVREAGNTQGAGGHTPTGHGVVTIGTGSTTSGAAFRNPYYGCYIWRRTA